jgi:preprotein translocase subunit SecG
MTARGAADFLTRSTAVLGGLFIVLSIVMAAIAGATRTPSKIDTSLAGKTNAPIQQSQPAPAPAPTQTAPAPAPANTAGQNQQTPAIPLAQ